VAATAYAKRAFDRFGELYAAMKAAITPALLRNGVIRCEISSREKTAATPIEADGSDYFRRETCLKQSLAQKRFNAPL